MGQDRGKLTAQCGVAAAAPRELAETPAGGLPMGRGRAVKLCVLFLLAPALGTHAAILPDGFQETVVIEGLIQPTAIRFAPDGRIFVAEKRGVVKVFDGPGDPLPDVLTDLGANVHAFWDRGLLGLAVDSEFPTQPYIYVFYTFDTSEYGGPWGDGCPTPPGPMMDGCLVDGRILLNIAGRVARGSRRICEGECAQYGQR